MLKSPQQLFTLSNKDKAGEIKLGNVSIQTEDKPVYSGTTLDKRLTWRPHIEKIEAKARKKLVFLRKLAGTNWGGGAANEATLKKVYTGAIRPVLEYGSKAWTSAANSHLQALNKVQNQALRLITGAMKTSPINEMEKITGITPLPYRRDTKTMVHAEKYKSMPAHPMRARYGDLASGRLKRSSFIHRSKKLNREYKEELPDITREITPTLFPVPWEQYPNLTIRTTINNYHTMIELNNLQKKTIVCNMIEDMYPREAWIQVYTEQSSSKAVKNRGARVYTISKC